MKIKDKQLFHEFLEEKYHLYHQNDFIPDDPISIPHQFSKKEDIEIAAFLSSIIAWGQRKTILNNANKMMAFMDYSPHDFILNHIEKDYKQLEGFVHRTFNSTDLMVFFSNLQSIYLNHGGLEACFQSVLPFRELNVLLPYLTYNLDPTNFIFISRKNSKICSAHFKNDVNRYRTIWFIRLLVFTSQQLF